MDAGRMPAKDEEEEESEEPGAEVFADLAETLEEIRNFGKEEDGETKNG